MECVFVENFAMGNKWQFERGYKNKSAVVSHAGLAYFISLIEHGAYC